MRTEHEAILPLVVDVAGFVARDDPAECSRLCPPAGRSFLHDYTLSAGVFCRAPSGPALYTLLGGDGPAFAG